MGLFRSMRVVGILVLAYSMSMLPPALVSLWYDDGEVKHFGAALLAISAVGVLIIQLAGVRGANKSL
ncbi:hypothetical protein MNBD_GAMMA14-373, partial [hydrothermal vent metagenome]